METSTSAHPSPALLNTVMTRLLLHQPDPNVSSAAHSYLMNFLFLHLARRSQGRLHWTNLVLSAFRDVKVPPTDQDYHVLCSFFIQARFLLNDLILSHF